MNIEKLVKHAINARSRSYSPYSRFKVGAALITKAGVVYEGANIESAAYSPSNCAERTAFFKAVYEGEKEFAAIAVIGGYDGSNAEFCYPCGMCRQVMMEFCVPDDFLIIVAKNENEYKRHLLTELLPYGFGPNDLNR